MSARVSPTEKIRSEIDALFTGDRDLAEVLEQVATLDADIEAMASAFARSSGLLRQQKLMAEKETPQHMDVTIGTFTFQVTWPEYVHWRLGIQDICKTRKATINAEIRRRLGL